MVPTIFSQSRYVKTTITSNTDYCQLLQEKRNATVFNICINFKMHPKWKGFRTLISPPKPFLPVLPVRENGLCSGQSPGPYSGLSFSHIPVFGKSQKLYLKDLPGMEPFSPAPHHHVVLGQLQQPPNWPPGFYLCSSAISMPHSTWWYF